MVSLAWRELTSSKGRLVASVGGVAFSMVLVLFMVGVYHGFQAASVGYIDRAGADVWVTTEGSSDVYALAGVAEDLEPRIRSVAGVADVSTVYTRIFHGDLRSEARPGDEPVETGNEVDVFVVGYDAETGLGGPGELSEGTAALEGKTALIDRALASEQGLGVGDEVRMFDEDFTVVGITSGAQVAFFSYVFIDEAQARESFRTRGLASYFVVRVRPGADPDAVAAAIEDRVRGVSALSTQAFGERNGERAREIFVPILLAITTIGLGVALAVITVTTWSAVNERLVEYGVLKAIGADARVLYRIVVGQAGFAAVAGFAAGVPAYLALTWGITRAVPRIPVVTNWTMVAALFGGALAIGLLAAVLPLRKVASVDPADVFRGGW